MEPRGHKDDILWMKTLRLSVELITDWLQIATGIVVIVGLALLIWELEQARELTQAQLTSEGWARLSERNLVLVEKSNAQVLTKACEEPGQLSNVELTMLDLITQDRLNALNRIYALSRDAQLYLDQDRDWSRFSESTFNRIFATQFGRVWWEQSKNSAPIEIVAIGDSILQSSGSPSCGEFYEKLIQELELEG